MLDLLIIVLSIAAALFTIWDFFVSRVPFMRRCFIFLHRKLLKNISYLLKKNISLCNTILSRLEQSALKSEHNTENDAIETIEPVGDEKIARTNSIRNWRDRIGVKGSMPRLSDEFQVDSKTTTERSESFSHRLRKQREAAENLARRRALETRERLASQSKHIQL